MPYRLTKIYTRKGDDGFTQLGDHRLSKDDLLVEAVGALDELNSHIGFVLTFTNDKQIHHVFTQIQNHLFDLGGELHLPSHVVIMPEHIIWLEKTLDAWNETLPPLAEFLLPRGNAAASSCHIARTVCRRAERALVKLHRQAPLNNMQLLQYLNRLSDVLFVAARILNKEQPEILWEHQRQ